MARKVKKIAKKKKVAKARITLLVHRKKAEKPISLKSKLPIREVGWYGWRPDVPDHHDFRLPEPSVDAFPTEAFLAPNLLPPIRDQGNQGSCTGHGTRSLGQYMRAKEGQEPLELSPRFIYYNARVMEHTVKEDSGAEIRDCIKQVARLGFASEKDCPYSAANFTKRPSNRAYVDARQDMAVEYLRPAQTLIGLKQAIAEGWGFVFGFAVYENFESPAVEQTGIMGMPQGRMLGGHCVWACGYNDAAVHNGAFLCGNSWNTNWGAKHPHKDERGYFYMPYSYITDNDLCDDFWVLRKVS